MVSTYDLETVKDLVRQKKMILTDRCRSDIKFDYGLKPVEIEDMLLELTDLDYHQTIISDETRRPNDVYLKKIYSQTYKRAVLTYIKLEIKKNRLVILISFHSST